MVTATISSCWGGRIMQPIDMDEMQKRLDRPDYAPVAASLKEVGFNSAVEIGATYAGRASDLRATDGGTRRSMRIWNMRLQYKAGLGLNSMLFPRSLQRHSFVPQISGWSVYRR